MLDKNIYMDDLLGGGHTEEEAFRLYQEIKHLLLEAQMPLSKWTTASASLYGKWQELGEDVAHKDVSFPPDDASKILGLHWSPKDDMFFFNRKIECKEPVTKRGILQMMARLFDPLGFLSPFTIRMKILMQDLWLSKVDWDSPVEEDVCLKWRNWVEELHNDNHLRVPRYLWLGISSTDTGWALHVFTDASEKAYGAVVYCQASSMVRIVASRARVAPLKRTSLPRLELMGALLGSRLLQYVIAALDMPSLCTGVHCWTDSQIVIHWIRGPSSRWRTFVANRVQEIQDSFPASYWRFVPGVENPADCLTRGEELKQLVQNQLWWERPRWLQLPSSDWPETPLSTKIAGDEERTGLVTSAVTVDAPPIDLNRFSSLNRLLRVTAWVKQMRNPRLGAGRVISVDEMEQALKYWIRQVQAEAFAVEIGHLQLKQSIRKRSAVFQLDPFLDEDGALRVKGRLQKADLPFEKKHPLLLPPGGLFVQLLILDVHLRLYHAGVQEVLGDVRERFWVIRGRKAVQRTLSRCLTCRRRKARPCTAPVAPPPADRVRTNPAFAVVGIDFAGPLYIRQIDDSVSKAYLALFSCAVTRAIHVEVISTMSTEALILALRRFFARYGFSHTIYSDNGRTFLRAQKELRVLWEMLKANEVQNFLTGRRAVWKTIAERAPWWGGFWERMVRSVKEKLKSSLGSQCLSLEELSTVLLEVSAILNSRPLCYQSEDSNENEALTPGHFIFCSRPEALLLAMSDITTSTAAEVRHRWKQRMSLLDGFWKRWQKDYLMQLRSLHLVRSKNKECGLKIGDVVILMKEQASRQCWPLGHITALYPGRDGNVRLCEVLTAAGRKFRRAVQHVCPLEV